MLRKSFRKIHLTVSQGPCTVLTDNDDDITGGHVKYFINVSHVNCFVIVKNKPVYIYKINLYLNNNNNSNNNLDHMTTIRYDFHNVMM